MKQADGVVLVAYIPFWIEVHFQHGPLEIVAPEQSRQSSKSRNRANRGDNSEDEVGGFHAEQYKTVRY